MDKDTLVENLIGDGEKLIAKLPQLGLEVAAAFWLKASEDDKWKFYIVSPTVDTEGFDKAHARLHPLVWAKPRSFRIDPLRIRLIGPSKPIAQDVLAALSCYSAHLSPIRWDGRMLGNMVIEDAYLYAPPVVAPTK
jgi:hypothetical protein